MHKYPVAIVAGVGLLLLISFSDKYQEKRKDSKVCARIGMDYCKTDRDKMIGGVMAAVLATQGTAWASAWALGVGFGLNLLLSNWKPGQKEIESTEE